MELKEFFSVYSNKTLKENSVLHFSTPEKASLPIIFVSKLISTLKKNYTSVKVIDAQQHSVDYIINILQTSFLGQGLLYWIRGVDEVDKKYRGTITTFIRNYHGPHTVFLFLPEVSSTSMQNGICIHIPSAIDASTFNELFKFFGYKVNSDTTSFIQTLYKSFPSITLDQACMMSEYIKVLGKNKPTVLLLEQIFESEKSLFTLSQYFFAKDTQRFFLLWSRFKEEYSVPFWCMFWSEQIWRAYYAYYYLRQKNYGQAKSIAYRLPFAYLQKDWKLSTANELKCAHDFIYQLDWAHKNNIETAIALELFYTKFFLEEFKDN